MCVLLKQANIQNVFTIHVLLTIFLEWIFDYVKKIKLFSTKKMVIDWEMFHCDNRQISKR